MKKNVWLLGVAVAALTSCTQSEVVDIPQSKLIGFETFVEKPTRSVMTDVKAENINSFYVYGTYGQKNGGIFSREDGAGAFYLPGLKVYKDNTSGWTYSHKSWMANQTFRFAAYTDGLGVANESDASAQYGKVTFIPNTTYAANDVEPGETDINDFFTLQESSSYLNLWGLKIEDYEVSGKDLIVAVPFEHSVGELTSAPGMVNLTFKHMLSKVQFEFIYGDEDAEMTVEVEPISFEVRDNGDLLALFGEITENGNKLSEPVIKWTAGNSDRVLTFFPQVSGKNQTFSSGSLVQEFYVLPQANNSITADIKVHCLDGEGNVKHTYVIDNFNLTLGSQNYWLPGYLYRYYATIEPNSHNIHFSVSVTDFKDVNYADKEIE